MCAELVISGTSVLESQHKIIEDLEKKLGVPFLDTLLKCIQERVMHLDQLSLNEYLFHIYHGVQNKTGLALWLFDGGLCDLHFKPELQGSPCILWILDLIRAAGGKPGYWGSYETEDTLELDIDKESWNLLGKVYVSEYLR